MSDSEWVRVEEIFQRAAGLAIEKRPAFLDAACAGDLAIRREVESLLGHAKDDGSTFARPIDDAPSFIGHYRLSAKIGEGGMGTVYRATDTRLGREVAIKVLPQAFADDSSGMSRFAREAKVLASLNHPNIAQIYGVEDRALVMELVQGQTLKRPLPLDTALRYARQIAEALEAAHEKGIVHRDLKPANILVTPDGVVKLLDFGLAAIAQPHAPTEAQPLTSPTITVEATLPGMIMGTAAYMSPEQASGKPADKRADIWSFGVVLFETLTGRQLFGGETISHTLADVLTGPIDFHKLPAEAPAKIRELLKRCLERNPRNRLRDIGDARIAIEEVLSGASQNEPVPVLPAQRRRSPMPWIAATIGMGLIAGIFAFAYFTRKAQDAVPVRFSFTPPFHAVNLDVAVSPDGTRVAVAGGAGESRIWLRSLDSFTAEELPASGFAFQPFWSPDGRSLGFTGSKLSTLDAGDRRATPHALVRAFYFGEWGPRGILYTPEATGAGLYLIPAGGGASTPVTKVNSGRSELSHRFPQFLPDGRHFIYWIWSPIEENTGIYVGSLDASEKLPEGPLVRTWREAQYAEPGYLLFLQGPTLMAQPFDAARLRLTGQPRSLPELVERSWSMSGWARFSVSRSGVLAYQEATPFPASRIVWRDRTGNELRSIEAPKGSDLNAFSLAPDEKRIAATSEDENALEDLWTVDLERATALRLTAIHCSNQNPVWSPDGRRLAFHSNREGVYDLYERQASGGSEEKLLLKGLHRKTALSWSPDGRFLVYLEQDPKTGPDLWVLPLEGDRKPFPFLKTEFNENEGHLSPIADSQGHAWMAYQSNETGRYEIYLRPFLPGAPDGPAGAEVRVSTAGGTRPRWRKDGKELFYAQGGKLWAVDVKLGASPEIGAPQALFAVKLGTSGYAPFADGRRFLFIERAGEPPAPKINVVLNWTGELHR